MTIADSKSSWRHHCVQLATVDYQLVILRELDHHFLDLVPIPRCLEGSE